VAAAVSILVALSMLALSFTRRRIVILCVFYFSFGLLTVLNDDSIPLLGGGKLYRIAYPFLLLSVLIRIFRDSDFLISAKKWPLFSYLALVFLTVISSLYSSYIKVFTFSDSASLFGVLVVMSLFWISASHIQGPEDPVIFGGTAAALSIAISVWVIWTASQADFSAFRGGTNVNENYESLFVLAGVFPVVNCLFLATKKVWRALLAAALFSIALGAFILASRGMIIAALVGVLAMFAGFVRKVALGRVVFASVILALIFVGAIFLPGGGNIVGAFQAPELGTLDDRTMIWGFSIQRFMQAGIFQTLLGGGLSSSINVITEYGNYHNVFLLWLMEQGIVGLALFCFFLYRIWRLVVASDLRNREMMLGWFVFFLIGGLSSTISNEHSFWIIMGVLSGTAALSKLTVPNNSKAIDMSGRILAATI
jgi:O-antigen ligase